MISYIIIKLVSRTTYTEKSGLARETTLRWIQVFQPAGPFFKATCTKGMETRQNFGLVEEILTNCTNKFFFDFLPAIRHFANGSLAGQTAFFRLKTEKSGLASETT